MKRRAFIITINNTHFVSGLTWKILPEARNPLKQAKNIGIKNGMDLVAIRKAAVLQQAGLLSRKDEVSPGIFSIALSLATILGNNWIGIFKLSEDGFAEASYLFVAVLEGNIVPQSDFVGTMDEVVEAKEKLQLITKNNERIKLYLPHEIDNQGEEKMLHELISPRNLKNDQRIKSLTFYISKSQLIGIGTITLAVLLVFLGIKHLGSYQTERNRKIFSQNISAEEIADETVDSVTTHLGQSVLVDEMISKLYLELNKTPLSIAGWFYSDSICQQGHITYRYKRAPESIVTLDELTNIIMHKYAVRPYYNINDGAEFALPVSMNNDKEFPENKLNEQSQLIISIFQKNKVNAVFSTPTSVTEYSPKDFGDLEKDSEQNKIHFSYESDIPPHIIFEKNNLKGLRINSIKTTLNHEIGWLHWSIEGDIYGK
ncbi:MAG: type 4b pilus protein PilO2 (plasmid) [Candidatus Symbiodolus clandestinus]